MPSNLQRQATNGTPVWIQGSSCWALFIPLFLFLALIPFTSCGDDGTGPREEADVQALMEAFGVPGASIAVINDFSLDYVEVHGVTNRDTQEPVTPDTRFQAASISKPLTAVAAMRLVREGKLGLDEDIDAYLASWHLPESQVTASQKVTLRRILSHTGGTTVHGFRGYRYTEALPALIQVLDGAPPANSAPIRVDYAPGTDQRYSGGGYVVLQQALVDIEGRSFPELMRETVLAPAGMAASTFQQPLPDSLTAVAAAGHYTSGQVVPGTHHIYPEMAAAGLWTTPSDLARFLIHLQRTLRDETTSILDRQLLELMITEVEGGFGLGFVLWAYQGERVFGHGGANEGFRSLMGAHPTDGYGVVVMTNSDNGDGLAEAVVDLIGKREGWPGF